MNPPSKIRFGLHRRNRQGYQGSPTVSQQSEMVAGYSANFQRSSIRYASVRPDDGDLRIAMKKVASERCIVKSVGYADRPCEK